jgi:hypothetical protein
MFCWCRLVVCITTLHLQVLDDLLRSPWFLVEEWLCVLVLSLCKNWMNYAVLTSPYLILWILSGRLVTTARVYAPFIWALLLFLPWHTSMACFVTKLMHGLAVACPAHMGCVLSYAETWAPDGCSVLVCSFLSWCCPWFWTSTSVHDTWCLSKLNICVIHNPCLVLVFYFAGFEDEYDQKIFFKAFSLGFSLEQPCNFPFSFLFIIYQFLYQEYCKDNVFCVDYQ